MPQSLHMQILYDMLLENSTNMEPMGNYEAILQRKEFFLKKVILAKLE
jgi:hypothetical protein